MRRKDGVDTISSHRDWTSTECPGERLYDQLPQIRENVAAEAGSADQEEPTLEVAITEPVDGSTFESDTTITFSAETDEGAAVSWVSDLDGELGSDKTIHTVLDDGTHKVTATATLDDATAQDTVSITVGEAIVAPEVSVTSIHQSPDGGRHMVVDVHIDDDADAPVAGAEVSADIWHADTDANRTALREAVSGTTDTHGHVSFRIRVGGNPPGCYTTIVTAVHVHDADWDGESPPPDPDPLCF